MGMIPLKCPSCGADITLDDSKEFGFCQFCGTKIQNDAIKRLRIQYSGDPMSVTHVHDNSVTNNTTNKAYYVDNRQANIVVSKPKISLLVTAIFLLTFGILFLVVTIEQKNPSGLILTLPLLAIGLFCIFRFVKQCSYYDMAIKNAIQRNDVTNKN